jgi:hypothetical protein
MVCRGVWDDDCECECESGVSHVRRRSVEGDCSVCREDLKEGETVWCKAGCGKSVHEKCFEGWRREREGRGREATCTDCRAVWVDECAC